MARKWGLCLGTQSLIKTPLPSPKGVTEHGFWGSGHWSEANRERIFNFALLRVVTGNSASTSLGFFFHLSLGNLAPILNSGVSCAVQENQN